MSLSKESTSKLVNSLSILYSYSVYVSLESFTGLKEDFLSFSVEDGREVFIIEIEGFQFDIGDHSVIIFSLLRSGTLVE